MRYRRFGRTELPMPVFSCGGMRYQQSWQDLSPDTVADENQRNLEATIARAWELGITHIETARGYGSSELQLGFVLPQLPRERLICQTKVVPTANPQDFRQTFAQSLGLLQLDYVDLLGLHGINNAETLDWSVRPGGCVDVAEQLKAQGKVRHIGFSTHGPTDVIVEAIETGRFDYVNLHWYYINQDNWPAIEAATRHDMGVFIISPSDKGGHLYNPTPKLVELCQPLHPMVFNDLFCLSHPQVHTLSLGAARPSDFDLHFQTLDLLDQADEILPPIVARLEAEAIAVLGQDWYDTWAVGLPEAAQVPGNINIHTILWLRNLLLAYDMEDYAKARYNLLGSGGHWFVGEQAGQVGQYDLKACLRESPHGDRIPALLQDTHDRLQGKAVQRLSKS
ncbi:MAG: aldo/keto reductase [Synechococcales cyanobacterium CRU_2_2]|nr:aldo/keto reductase [Synechococcales cyanobacterium CRU_2_2]